MGTDAHNASVIARELSLLDPSVRKSPTQLSTLIADDFIEFGVSGKIYNKKDCLRRDEYPRIFAVSDLKTTALSKDIMLVTYKTTENDVASLRSSLWRYDDDSWKIIFHQGTKAQEENNGNK